MTEVRHIAEKRNGKSSSSAATPTRHKPRFDVSINGMVYCVMMTMMGLAAIQGQANLLFGIFGMMIGVVLISGSISITVLRRLSVTRTVPEYCVVGRPTTVIYHFQNHKRFSPSLSVTLSELDGVEATAAQPTAYLLHAPAGMSVSAPITILPKCRGRYELGQYQLSTSFPFGFIKRAATRREPDSLLVCPALGEVSKQLMGLCRSEQRADAPIKPRGGGQDEFYGVKEHRPGENPRWIYWRRSARTPGLLVSKELTQVAPPRLMILADTYLETADLAGLAAVEKTLAMAASLASQALEEGLSVGLCAWDGEEWVVLPAQQGKRQRRDLLAILAGLPRNTSADSAALLEKAEILIKTGTAAVLFTPTAMQVSLTERLRGALVVVPALSPWTKAWFTFDPGIDFTKCIPPDSQPPPRRQESLSLSSN